jgi:predicted site-specific integrase-resolvase
VPSANGQQNDSLLNSLLNKKQAARYLGVSGGTLERLMRDGLPYIKLTSGAAGAVRFQIGDLVDFVVSRRVRSGDAA